MLCIRPNRDEMLDKSFYTHIWMINKLLEQARVKSGSRPFLLYVIASCYLKMLIRMDYRTSETICNTLKNLSTFDFSNQLHKSRQSEKENDCTFLSTFLRYKPLLNLQTDAPNLTHRAETLPRQHDFYTKETCLEFHLLLSELLGRLHGALNILNSSRGNVGVDEILVQLESIGRLGYLIRLMVKGTAIKKHLKVIEDYLPDRPAPLSQAVKQEEGDGGNDSDSDGDDNDDNDNDNDNDNTEGDENSIELDGNDAEALHRAQPLPKWQIWSDWLEVMVIHFDSTQILDGFINLHDPNLKLDIKVLSQPLPDNHLLNWRELLPLIAPLSVANDLIRFLEPEVKPEVIEKRPTPEDVSRLVNDLGKIPQVAENVVVFTKAVDHIIPQMEALINYSAPWSEASVTSMVDKLNSLKGTWIHTTRGDLVKEITRISKKVGILTKCPAATAEDIIRLVSDLGKIPRVEENVVVFANAVDHLIPQMKTLTNYSVPWSEASIMSMVDTLDSLKDTWIRTSQDDLIKKITRISKKIGILTKGAAPTAEDVSGLTKDLGKIPRVEENVAVFTNAVDHIISQLETLTTPIPWSETFITSIVNKLDILKGTWMLTSQDNLIKETAQIAERIRTLTKRPTAEDLGRMVKNLGTIRQVEENVVVFVNSVDHIVSQMAALTNCSSPWSEVFITSIVRKLNSFKDMWIYTTQDDSIKEITKIAEMIRTLRDNAKLFHALGTSEPLSTGTGFKGSCHCEKGLAAFCCADEKWGHFVSHLFLRPTQIVLM